MIDGYEEMAAPAPDEGEAKLSGMKVRRLSDVAPEPIRWLWPGRIARGKPTVVAGDPGLGKSQITASIAAITSTGGKWPVSQRRAEPGKEQGHSLYEQAGAISAQEVAAGRTEWGEFSPEAQAKLRNLIEEQKKIYEPAAMRSRRAARAGSTIASQASRETGEPSRLAKAQETGRGGAVSKAQAPKASSSTSKGVPASSRKRAEGGRESRLSSEGVAEGISSTSTESITQAPGGETPGLAAMAYHGSPHWFDRFDITKTGTGEGAAPFGHGIYLAENPAVAGEYQINIGANRFEVDGTVVDLRNEPEYVKGRKRPRQRPSEVLAAVSHVLTVVTLADSKLNHGEPLNDDERESVARALRVLGRFQQEARRWH